MMSSGEQFLRSAPSETPEWRLASRPRLHLTGTRRRGRRGTRSGSCPRYKGTGSRRRGVRIVQHYISKVVYRNIRSGILFQINIGHKVRKFEVKEGEQKNKNNSKQHKTKLRRSEKQKRFHAIFLTYFFLTK